MTNLHIEAMQLLAGALPHVDPAERQAVRGVADSETGYGVLWGSDPKRGAGSNNTGAITDPHYVNHAPKGEPPTPPNDNQFLHEDSRPDKNDPNVIIHYVTAFKKYDSLAAGLVDNALVMLKPNVREAVKTRNVRNIAAAMYKNVYFTGEENTAAKNINVYARKLFKCIANASAVTGEANPFVLGVEDTDPPIIITKPTKPITPGAPTPATPDDDEPDAPAPVLPEPPLLFGTSWDLPLLIFGAKGNAVTLWQRLMGLPLTGIYDETCVKTTWAFQENWNLENPDQRIGVDGKVGPKTWSKVRL